MLVYRSYPLRTCAYPTVMPVINDTLTPKNAQMSGELVSQLFILMGIAEKNLDSHHLPPRLKADKEIANSLWTEPDSSWLQFYSL
jgi:hypothetical protein